MSGERMMRMLRKLNYTSMLVHVLRPLKRVVTEFTETNRPAWDLWNECELNCHLLLMHLDWLRALGEAPASAWRLAELTGLAPEDLKQAASLLARRRLIRCPQSRDARPYGFVWAWIREDGQRSPLLS